MYTVERGERLVEMLADGGVRVKAQNAFYKRNWHYIALENTRWKTEAKISPKTPVQWKKCLLLPPISASEWQNHFTALS